MNCVVPSNTPIFFPTLHSHICPYSVSNLSLIYFSISLLMANFSVACLAICIAFVWSTFCMFVCLITALMSILIELYKFVSSVPTYMNYRHIMQHFVNDCHGLSRYTHYSTNHNNNNNFLIRHVLLLSLSIYPLFTSPFDTYSTQYTLKLLLFTKQINGLVNISFRGDYTYHHCSVSVVDSIVVGYTIQPMKSYYPQTYNNASIYKNRFFVKD